MKKKQFRLKGKRQIVPTFQDGGIRVLSIKIITNFNFDISLLRVVSASLVLPQNY